MPNEEQWQVSAEAREHTRGNKPERSEAYRHAGLIGDNRLRRLMSVAATHYDPAGDPTKPGAVEGTKLYNMILQNESTETLTRAIHSQQPQTQSYFVGDPAARSDISGLKALKKMEDMIIRPAPIIYVFGEPGSGKTNISLLFSQLWKREHEGGEIGTNIRTLEQKDDWLPNYGTLNDWLGENIQEIDGGGQTRADDTNPKLFVFDEASSHASGRGKAGYEAGEKLGPLVYKIRKASAGIIIIGHDGKDVHPAIRTLATVVQRYRGEMKKATVWEDVKDRQGRGKIMELAGVPQTDWNYDDGEATSWSWDSPNATNEKLTQKEAQQQAIALAEEMTTEQVRQFAASMAAEDNGLSQEKVGELIGNASRGKPYSQQWVYKWMSELN